MNKNFTSWLILFFLVLVWGTSFLLIKKAVFYFEAVEVGLLRVSFAFLFVLPLFFSRIKRINLKQAFLCFLSGLIGTAIPAVLFAMAETGIDSATAGVLNSLTTLFTLLVGVVFFKTTVKWINVAGVLIGLAGAVGLITVSGGNSFNFNLGFSLYVISATLMYAFNANFIKSVLKEIPAIDITVFAIFFTGFMATVWVIFFSDIPDKMITDSENLYGVLYVAILGIIGTGLAMLLFNHLIKKTSAVFAASVTYLMPVVAILWGMLDGEVLGIAQLLWIMLILAGVLMVNTRTSKIFQKFIQWFSK